MKEVYLAHDLHLHGRSCALAEMIDAFSDDAMRTQAVAAFQREARILAGLDEKHIPQVFDSFSEQNRHYLVMEYINGETLEQKIRSSQGRLSETEVIQIALEIVEALEYLHGLKPPIIYRDLKPSNVMVTTSGLVKLIDFGIARYFQPANTATMVGTQGYAPPEQYKGKSEPRSDVYSLGALMHQLVSGRDPTIEPPFSFPPLKQIAPKCSAMLDSLVNDALVYDVTARISTAAEFKTRLEQIDKGFRLASAETVQIASPIAQPRIGSVSTNSWSQTILSLTVLALIGGAGALIAKNLAQEHPSPDEASTERSPSPPTLASAEPSSVPTPLLDGALPKSTKLKMHSRRAIPKSAAVENRRAALSNLHSLKVPLAVTPVHRRLPAYPPTELAAATVSPKMVVNKPEPDTITSTHKRDVFEIGSTKNDVLAAQGTPTGIIDGHGYGDIWSYGLSSVDFSRTGAVKGYSNISGNLHVSATPTHSDTLTTDHFSLGSTKDQVLAVQGTPTSVIDGHGYGDIWSYGLSSVDFAADGVVKGYSNISANLHVRATGREGDTLPKDYFSLGSTKDEVLAVQGTPTSVIDGHGYGDIWSYGLSNVDFTADGVVKGYSNISDNLHIKVR